MSLPRPDMDDRPLAARAAAALEAKMRSTEVEDAARLQRAIEDTVNTGRLQIARLAEVPETRVQLGQPRFSDDLRSASIDGVVDGIVLRWVKTRTIGSSSEVVQLVRSCSRCGDEDATPVRFLWAIGDARVAPTHPQGCPRDAVVEAVAPVLRPMTASEATLIEGVLGIVREHGGFLTE